ncbi:cyanophycinase [Bacillus sp. RO1]|uniref:cyanophycinase n=1 Tax=Bacillus sp. RO1 TaxID=2722703 RepID=UPI001456815C|nr:cyanophycinase [Bacillus sp. RO1]NLP49532.1 cyanophycinase [Bacillus sp. RO1]
MLRKQWKRLTKMLAVLLCGALLFPATNGYAKPSHVHDTNLKGLQVHNGKLEGQFSPETKVYMVKTNNDELLLSISPKAVNAKVAVNGMKVNHRKQVKVKMPSGQNSVRVDISTPRDITDTYTLIVQSPDYDLRDVTLIQTGDGSVIQDYKLGFQEAQVMDGVEAYLMFYSKKNFNEVWNYIKTLTPEEIDQHLTTQTEGENKNKIFKITNLSYADGGGNTFRSGQLDVMSGKPLSVGDYYAYAATIGENGVLGMTGADRTISILPYPTKVELQGSGNQIDNYSVTFEQADDENISHYFLFYSSKGLTKLVEPLIRGESLDFLKKLERESRGKLLSLDDVGNGPVSFNHDQKTIEGDPLGSSLYYAYVAEVSEEKVLGSSKSLKMINTNTMPVPLKVIGDGQGTLLPAGGATGSTDAYFDAIREATGVERPRIAIFNSSRDSADIAYDHFHLDDGPYLALETEFKNRGFEPVYIPLAIDTFDFVAYDDYFVNLVKSSHAVMLQGGDQMKHGRSLLEGDGAATPMLEAIRYVHDNGGVIAGTSAGAHAMSNPMFGVGDSFKALVINETEVKTISDVPLTGFLDPTIPGNNFQIAGLGLIENVLTDTHFDKRGRLGRLLVAMRDTGHQLGFGLDEGTAIELKGDIGKVVGENGVWILDASNATFNEKGMVPGFEAEHVIVHHLTEGDTFNLVTKEVTPGEGKEQVYQDEVSLYDSPDLFGEDYESTKSLLSFVKSSETEQVTTIKDSAFDQVFTLQWAKDDISKYYQSDENYKPEALNAYKKGTVTNVSLSISVETASQPVEVSSVQTYSYNDTFFIEFTGPVDPTAVSEGNVDLNGLAHAPGFPKYLSATNEIEVRATSDFPVGHEITIRNLKDADGEPVPDQTWKRVLEGRGQWEKVN